MKMESILQFLSLFGLNFVFPYILYLRHRACYFTCDLDINVLQKRISKNAIDFNWLCTSITDQKTIRLCKFDSDQYQCSLKK